MPLIFDADHLPQAMREYVAWVDVMGTQASMSRSLAISANFIFKLHTAALQAPIQNVTLYPIMDGFYASSPDKGSILDFLRSVFEQVGQEFNGEPHEQHRFIIKGALAFGPVIHGTNVPPQASQTINNSPQYRNSLLLGIPMVQANISEKLAPPFGIYVHESARSFAPPDQTPLHYVWWTWRNPIDRNNSHRIWNDLSQSLESHFTWCAERAGDLEYAPDRIEAHRAMAQQYFILPDFE